MNFTRHNQTVRPEIPRPASLAEDFGPAFEPSREGLGWNRAMLLRSNLHAETEANSEGRIHRNTRVQRHE